MTESASWKCSEFLSTALREAHSGARAQGANGLSRGLLSPLEGSIRDRLHIPAQPHTHGINYTLFAQFIYFIPTSHMLPEHFFLPWMPRLFVWKEKSDFYC